jgi:hypothetical protein
MGAYLPVSFTISGERGMELRDTVRLSDRNWVEPLDLNLQCIIMHIFITASIKMH